MFSFLKINLPILIIILILFSYLGIKTLDEDGWDGWGFGSAQTLMSSRYWARDGFIKNYFLFIPSPYSKLVQYLDSPEFRNRPIETLNGALNRNRIYYTHYPSLYLVPFAAIAKIGFTSRFVFRILALIISLSGLIFFYWFIKLISDKTTALVASIYYGFSFTFLNYADSLANQSFNILFAFLILTLSVLASRNFENRKIYARYNFAIWLVYFTLALSSYDTTFFVFVWLVLYDAIILKKFLWQKWLFWTSAPILGFSLQIIQNTWYLGWADAMRDIYTSYTGRAIGSLKNFILGLIMPFVSMTSLKTIFIFKKTVVALTSAAAIFGILWKFRQRIGLDANYFKIIFILAVAAVAQPFFINVTGHWSYQGVLTAPFWGLLIGIASVGLLQYIAVLKYSKERTLFMILFLIVLGLWFVRFYDTFGYVKDWPNNRPDQKVIEFSREIKKLYPSEERIAFRIIPKNPILKSQFPTFNFEYYLGIPKIDFANSHDLLVDFWWFRNISEYPFYSFIIAENKSDIEKIRQELIIKNLKNISPIMNIQEQYLFTVGPK
ncbi:MAG: hypothetical protein AABW57_02635 [Nanoarchaeota archaeon]